MKTMRDVTIAVSAGCVAMCLCLLILDVRCWVNAQFGPNSEAERTRAMLRDELTRPALARIDALSALTDARVLSVQTTADKRTGEALALVRMAVDKADSQLTAANKSIAEVSAIRADLKPVLENAAALAKDGQDSLDDLYPDLRSLTESSEVAVTSGAQMAEVWRDAAPKIAQSVVGVGKSADAIATDVRREADEITKPKKWWQKMLGPVYTAGRLMAAFL